MYALRVESIPPLIIQTAFLLIDLFFIKEFYHIILIKIKIKREYNENI
jgi:hypothetical protein